VGDLILLSEAQMRQIEPYFPLSHGVPRVDDRRVISGIVFVIRKACAGVMRRATTGRTRRSTTGSCGGAGLACSTRFLPGLRARRANPTG
jgi:hypothetical protein